MIAAAWTAFKGSKVMSYLIVAAAAIGAVVLVLARAFGAGKASERAEAATKSLSRTAAANAARAEASQPVTSQEEADDPFNRDARR